MPADERQGAPVIFVNRFSLRTSPGNFEEAFAEVGEFMRSQEGFIRYTLCHHADRPDDYINIAYWQDAEAFRQALSATGFRDHSAALRAVSTSEPNLYIPRHVVTGDAVQLPRRDAS